MNRDAIRRTMQPATAFRARVALRAGDTPQQRAENIVTLMGATTGDPSLIAQHVAVIRDALMQYQELDNAARHR
jgi:hypothetical protein